MDLPWRLGHGHFTEKYRGNNQYNGIALRTAYFVRAYVTGVASDKIPLAKYRNPLFALKFAEQMGGAAAVDMIVGRQSSTTGEILFDTSYEVVRLDEDGLPRKVKVTDHAGSFVNYEQDFAEYVAKYAQPVIRRKDYVTDYAGFAAAYVEGFRRKLTEVQGSYRARKGAFDELFSDRPYDTTGSGAYRWACALRRLDACDPERVTALLKEAIGC